jgi:hypothetical protein
MTRKELVYHIERALDTEVSWKACYDEARRLLPEVPEREVHWATEAVVRITRHHDAPRIFEALRMAAETGDVERAIVALAESPPCDP